MVTIMGTLFTVSHREVENIMLNFVPFLNDTDRETLADVMAYPGMDQNHFCLGLDGHVYRWCDGNYVCVSTNGERWAPYMPHF